jgi:hypothetical protein
MQFQASRVDPRFAVESDTGDSRMSKYRAVPVFFDPDQKRWPRLRRGVFLTGLIFSSLFGVLIATILINPLLPKLNLPKMSFLSGDARAPTAGPVETESKRRLRETKQRLELERSKRQQARHPRAPHDPSIDQLDVGFYVSWDETSLSSLKDNIKNLDVLIGEFLHLESADGELREENNDNPDASGSITSASPYSIRRSRSVAGPTTGVSSILKSPE